VENTLNNPSSKSKTRSPFYWERRIGYGLIVLISLAALALLNHLKNEASEPAHIIRVHFPQVGTLMTQDPIEMRGVVIGQVHGFELLPEGTLVLMELFQREPLPEDARFVNFNHSLMGARHVVVVPGKSSTPMDLTQTQPGVFANGVAETLHRVGSLLHIMLDLKETADGLQNGRDSLLSFQGFLEQKVYPLLEGLASSGLLLDSLDHRIASSDVWVAAGLQGAQQIPAWQKRLDSLAQTAQAVQKPVTELLDQVESLVERMERYAAMASDPQSPLYAILSKPTFYQDLRHITGVLQKATRTLREEGLRDAIQWRNIHLRKRAPAP
jgi:hypothetical protein